MFPRSKIATTTEAVTTEVVIGSQVRLNYQVGKAFEAELAATLTSAGRQVELNVYRWTPFGKRFYDIAVYHNGKLLGYIEAKTGNSSYTALQGLKEWVEVEYGIQTQLVRKM